MTIFDVLCEIYFLIMVANLNKNYIFANSNFNLGGLAHLARAFDWQSKGDRFESDILHKLDLKGTLSTEYLFLLINLNLNEKVTNY